MDKRYKIRRIFVCFFGGDPLVFNKGHLDHATPLLSVRKIDLFFQTEMFLLCHENYKDVSIASKVNFSLLPLKYLYMQNFSSARLYPSNFQTRSLSAWIMPLRRRLVFLLDICGGDSVVRVSRFTRRVSGRILLYEQALKI